MCVNGLGISGPPVARALAARGARVIAVDGRDDEGNRRIAKELEDLDITVTLNRRPRLPDGTELVITTPGWRPGTPLLAAAAAAGIPVIGDVEMAWRLRPVLADGSRQDWLAVTGTNGKTTTVQMLAAMLGAAGYRSVAAGNVGLSVVDAIGEQDPYPVLAVELSSFQLYWSQSVRPLAAVVLNVAAHHLDWHGDIESYALAKGRVYAPGTVAVCNADDARSRALAAAAAPHARRVVGFRLGEPGPGELGVAGECCWTGPLTIRAARTAWSWPTSPTCSRRRRTTWPTRSPRRRWPGPTAPHRRRSAAGWTGSGLRRTG